MNRLFQYIVSNAGTGALIYFTYLGKGWASNLLWFFVVFGAIIMPLAALISEARNKIQERGRSVPKILDDVITFVFVVAAVGFISPWMGGIIIWNWLWQTAAYEHKPKAL